MTNRNEDMSMTTPQPSLFTRPDTFFGVCQGVGDDVGIHPNLLRVAFGMAFFFLPVATVAVYVGLGLVVLATRTLYPVPTPVAPAAVEPAMADDIPYRLAA